MAPRYPISPSKGDTWREYEPLTDTPDLFLKFARLHEKGNPVKSVVEWVHQYGVLGEEPRSRAYSGTQDLTTFGRRSAEAAGTLALYEAAVNKDIKRAKSVVLEEFPFVTPTGQLLQGSEKNGVPLCEHCIAKEIAGIVETIYRGDYLAYALSTAVENINDVVRVRCRPWLILDDLSRDSARVADRWTFDDLLGAMYLQMYWLVAAGGNVTRCEYCMRIVSLARPSPGVRKPPQHKRFCSKACRQSYHYHNKVKLRRQAKDDTT